VNDDLYHDRLVALARAAYGHGALAPPCRRAEADNPLCGDRVVIEVRIAHAAIEELAHRVKGCLLCQAAAAALGVRAPGAPEEEVRRAFVQVRALLQDGAALPAGHWPELALFAPVRAYKSRHRCVLLPFEALLDAMGVALEGATRKG
jgi:nitrogen fixation NifU-like protein